MKFDDNAIVSIVVPVYNGENYIEDCIRSILNQDYKNIEVIVVNDGSSDGTEKIVEKILLGDKRVKLITQTNHGVSAARNAGIKISSGVYVTFVDADDTVKSDYISYLYHNAVQYNADISLTPFPNKITNRIEHSSNSDIDDAVEVWTGKQATVNMLYYKVVISSWNKMFRINFLRDNGIEFDKNLSYGEGFEFTVKAFQKCNKVVVGHRKIYNYRVDNKNSVMTTFKKNLVLGSIESQNVIHDRLIIHNSEIQKAWRYSNWHTNCDCLNTIIGCHAVRENYDLYKRVKKVCRRDAKYAFTAPIPYRDKVKGLLYLISPDFSARVINRFRVRKFTRVIPQNINNSQHGQTSCDYQKQ